MHLILSFQHLELTVKMEVADLCRLPLNIADGHGTAAENSHWMGEGVEVSRENGTKSSVHCSSADRWHHRQAFCDFQNPSFDIFISLTMFSSEIKPKQMMTM